MSLNISTAAINAGLASINVAPGNVLVRLNTSQSLVQATELRAQIISRIGTITDTVNLTSNIASLLTQLIALVRQLILAMQGIPSPLGSAAGGHGGSGGERVGFMFGLGGIAAGYL